MGQAVKFVDLQKRLFTRGLLPSGFGLRSAIFRPLGVHSLQAQGIVFGRATPMDSLHRDRELVDEVVGFKL
jgi:hypothetical protein